MIDRTTPTRVAVAFDERCARAFTAVVLLMCSGTVLGQQEAGALASESSPLPTSPVDAGDATIPCEAAGSSFNDVYSFRSLASTPNFSKQAVVIYVDDVPSASTFTNFPQLLGASALEIFRGPGCAADKK